ncbi:hypothetical protein [Persephonella sp.]
MEYLKTIVNESDLATYCEIVFRKRPEELTDEEKEQLRQDIEDGRFGNVLNWAYNFLYSDKL